MREALAPIGFIIKVTVLLMIAAYPITMIVQLVSQEIKPFTIYNNIIIDIFVNYWSWVVVTIALLIFANKANVMVKTLETLRIRMYDLELLRWHDTPYISPLQLFYLMSPPVAITNDKKSNAYDELYKNVTSNFRDRVFINAKYTSSEPKPTLTIWTVAGKQIWVSLITNTILGASAVIGPFYLNPVTQLFEGWAKVFIPLAFFFLLSNFYLLRALQIGHPIHAYREIEKHFGIREPRVTWGELFPKTPYGETILFAWRSDCEKRQRLFYELANSRIPDTMEYNSPGLAVKPFESLEIPVWAPIAEQTFIDHNKTRNQQVKVKKQAAAKTSIGNVIEFKRKGS